MKQRNNWWMLSLIVLLTGGLLSCSDNPSGSDLGEEPSIPQIKNHKPEVSYFEENYPAGQSTSVAAEYTNFNAAALLVTGSASSLAFSQDLGATYLSLAQNNSAETEDGAWIWEYDYSYEGESLSIKLTAEPVDEGMEWAMFFSSSGSQNVNFDNYKFMEGTVSSGGDSGVWYMHDFEPDQDEHPALTFEWDIVSETEKVMMFTAYDDDQWSMEMNYEENGSEYLLTIDSDDNQSVTEVGWNTDSGTGYMIEGGTKSCWNADFANVSCE